MKKNYIPFKQQRELGEILSSMFQFIRENYKSFFKVIFKIIGPVLILLIASIAYYTYTSIGKGLAISNSTNFNFGAELFISFLVMGIAVLLYYAVMNAAVFHYIQSYIRHKGEVNTSEVSQGVKKDFGKLILLFLATSVLMLAGFMLFIIPGIYISVPLGLTAAILVFNNEGVRDSIGESFQLVKENWWSTLVSLLLIWIIVYLISLIFKIPLVIYTIVKMITTFQEGTASNVSGVFDWVYIALSLVASIAQYIVYSFTPIGVALVYFHLNEKKNFTGTYENIDNLGNPD